MARVRKARPRRRRIGRVSYFPHHGAWYVYYRDGRQTVRRRVGESEQVAAQVAAEVNGQLAAATPTLFSFAPILIPELRRRFLDHHEEVLGSSLATVRRYRAATKYLEDFGGALPAHKIDVEQFVRFLRKLQIAPMGAATRRAGRESHLPQINARRYVALTQLGYRLPERLSSAMSRLKPGRSDGY